jgi:hypothetical protein
LGDVPARTRPGLITCVAAAPPKMVMKSRRLMLSSWKLAARNSQSLALRAWLARNK